MSTKKSPKTLGEILDICTAIAGVESDRALSEAMGLSPSAVSKWRSGYCQPSVHSLMVVAKFADVPIQDLMVIAEKNPVNHGAG